MTELFLLKVITLIMVYHIMARLVSVGFRMIARPENVDSDDVGFVLATVGVLCGILITCLYKLVVFGINLIS